MTHGLGPSVQLQSVAGQGKQQQKTRFHHTHPVARLCLAVMFAVFLLTLSHLASLALCFFAFYWHGLLGKIAPACQSKAGCVDGKLFDFYGDSITFYPARDGNRKPFWAINFRGGLLFGVAAVTDCQ